MSDPTLSLIVVTHNSARWLPDFFKSWSAAAQYHPVPHEIILADSGSIDGSLQVARTLCLNARLITCGNIGYGAAVNRAAALAAAPWLLICNPDLTFPADFLSGWGFPAEVDAATPKCLAPALLNPDGSAQPSVGNFPSICGILADQFRRRKNRKIVPKHPDRPCPIPWATGACLFVYRKAFQSIGGFDEKFFLHVEEVDLQRRLCDAGCATFFFPQKAVTHHAPAASRRPDRKIKRYAALGLLRYFAKHGSSIQLLAYRLLALLSCRLSPGEALASRKKILDRPTGP